jgi:citrate lyase subunit beta/citryl-CoA lyase
MYVNFTSKLLIRGIIMSHALFVCIMAEYPRRSFLYTPANEPSKMRNALDSTADGVTFDLEDTVPDGDIPFAREMISDVLGSVRAAGTEIAVRINDLTTDYWLQDLETAVTVGADTVRLPMVESARQVHTVIKAARTFDGRTPSIILTLETPAGILSGREIIENCAELEEISGISTGIGDYAQAVGAEPSPDVRRFLDHKIIAIAALNDLSPIASVYTDIGDLDGLRKLAEGSRDIGYIGQSAIHPEQVPVINDVYTPSMERVEQARRVIEAFDSTESDSITVEGEFIDTPIVNRYRRLLNRYRAINEQNRI